ncbi:glycosyltransferase [Defluviimonas sp. WL0002]|uniref:Glycosyltransferase n=1 Tax=Albidovulum marisflavi TaxID=2984159 RepID=A0ABT2ZHD6_9RHOB|nr:glycosyltransferase [Defluviimonas sp. WL0002]MCV2870151.1 glycosyltransferase [Defluviimonas sp. WL0002]
MKEAVVVLGMHRSGTSFLARSLSTLGYDPPCDAQPGANDNRHGHFEPRAVVALNDRILASIGGRWDQVAPFLPATVRAAIPDLPEQMRIALGRSFAASSRAVLKDPRLSLTFGLWRPVLESLRVELRILISLRHPVAVAQSLAMRNACPPEVSALSWIDHVASAIDASEGLPRAILTFPDWVTDPASGFASVGSLLALSPEDQGRWAAQSRRIFCSQDLHCKASSMERGWMSAATRMFEALRRGDDPAMVSSRAREQLERAQQILAPLDRYRLREMAVLSGGGRPEVASELERQGALLPFAQARIAALERMLQVAERSAVETARGYERDRASLARRIATLRRAACHREERMAAQRHSATVQRQSIQRQLRTAMSQLATHAAGAETARGIVADLDHRLTTALVEGASLRQERDALRQRCADLARSCQKEMLTVFQPIYRRLYRGGGSVLRSLLPAAEIERIKRVLPHPEGIPRALAIPAQVSRKPTETEVPPWTPADDKPDIFVFSIINWDFRTQRPQHLSTEFARRGHRVFYLEMECEPGPGSLRAVAQGVWSARLSDRGVGFVRPYSGQPSGKQIEAWLENFHALCNRVGASPWRHIVVEHPYWWAFARHLPAENRITFDCMDEIAGFSNTEAHTLAAEEEMVAQCDRMVVSSEYLMQRRGALRGAALVRNGADIGHFTGTPNVPLPERIAANLRPDRLQVGYVGAIADWFDDDLVAEVARLAPDMDIHLCGAVTAPGPMRLADLPNVSLYGEIAYSEVPAFLAAMDVMIIPFRLLPIIAACDPVKFYEYSAAMRPTVATPMPELGRAGQLVRTALAPEAFAQAIRDAAGQSGDLERERLRNYALSNTWSNRATAMLAEMERAPLVSVVILAWGDAAVTMTAVHALLGEGKVYPALEVIVVDNGSPAEECARLADYLSRFPEARLIENGANLGFAAGNNVGIAAARGEFVLLLNNDTFVAPGAIWAMVRHLERTPEIGVVGPLTNNIGNEARVPVDYADMDAMRVAARRLTQGFRGRWTPLPVVAYFCAMFRRDDLARFGLLDPVYGRGMFEDDDHCAVIRAQGFECALAEDAFVHHHLSASFSKVEPTERKERFEANRQTYEGRWGPWTPHRYRDARPAPAWEAA